MATYPVVNKETGEQKEVTMSINEWDAWKEANPDWIRDWSDPSTAPMSVEEDWHGKLYKQHPDWKQVMKGVKKAAPRNASITQKY